MENNQPLTKKDLDQTVDDLASKVILPGFEALDKKIDGVADRLDEKIDGVADRLDKKIDKLRWELDAKIDKTKEELGEQITLFKDEVLTREDETINELKIIRTEMAAHTTSDQDLNERVSYLENAR